MPVKSPWIFVFGLFLLPASVCADQAHDVVMGNGTVGPYALSWKQVAAGTASVHVGALLQTQGLDYSFDSHGGTVTFTKPLSAQAAAEVDYLYDPSQAVHTGANLAIPLAFDLARGEHGSLSLDAMYKQAGTGSGTGALTVGLGGGWQGAGGQITTRLLFAPDLQSQAPGKSTDPLARAGLALSGSSQVSSAAKLTFGFSRIGDEVRTAADNGWKSGMQTLTLGGSFAPSRAASASVDYTQADPLAAGKAMTTQLATSLTLTPLRALQLQTHWTQSTDADVATETHDFSLSAHPNTATELTASLSGKDAAGAGSDTQAMAMAAKVTPDKALLLQAQVGQSAVGQAGTTQTAALSVDAQPTTTSQVNASFSLSNAPGVAADTQAVSVAAKLAPTHVISLNASAGQSRLGDATTDHQQIAVSLTPRTQVQLHSGVSLSQTEQYQTTATNFGGVLKPVAFLQFSADYTAREAPSVDPALHDALDTSTAQVALSPLKGLRVTGHYAQNPGDGAALQHVAQRGLGLETTIGALSLTGGYDWSRQYDTPGVGTALNFGLGLRVSGVMQITGGYKQALTGVGTSPVGASLYSFGLTHNLGDRFNLSMTGTMQQQTGMTVAASPNYTASANLGMKF